MQKAKFQVIRKYDNGFCITKALSVLFESIFLLYFRVNGQYIMEGLAASFLFSLGGIGFIILEKSNAANIPKLNRSLLLFIGAISILISFGMSRVFMRMKLP